MAALIYSPAYARYDLGPEHPFSPDRLSATFELVQALGVPLDVYEPAPARREDILAVHEPDYVAAVEAASTGNLGEGRRWGLGTADTPVFAAMDEAARLLVGGTLLAARLVDEGSEPRALQLGGGLHHAHPARAAGFCIYNDLAVAIADLVARGRFVAYLDIDVHHGDGVQHTFFASEKVLTISLHEAGEYLFPGSGGIHEIGEGAGRGLKVNLPLAPFTSGDSYLEVFEMVVPRALAAFGPDVLVVQAGADAHYEDPLADLALSTRDFERLFRRIVELADAHAGGRLVVTLGGGYALGAAPRVWAILALLLAGQPVAGALPPAWAKRWGLEGRGALHDAEAGPVAPAGAAEIAAHNRGVATRLLDALARYWF